MIYTRTINFNTTAANTELLNVTAIKAAIKEALGLSDEKYAERLANNFAGEKLGFRMSFDIVGNANNTIKINGGAPQSFVAESAFSNTADINIYSLVLVSAGSGTLTMNLKR